MAEPVDFAATVEVVGAFISAAAQRGDGSGMLSLGRRLQALLEPPGPPTTARETQALVDRVHETLVTATSAWLVPDVLVAVVDALRDDCHGTPWPGGFAADAWIAFEPEAFRARGQKVRADMARAQIAALGACRRYEQTRLTSHLRDAVKELEWARRSERERLGSGLVASSCDEEFDRLGRALAQALPSSAFEFLVNVVRHEVAAVGLQEGGGQRRSRAKHPEQWQWLLRDAWTVHSGHREQAGGVWFIDWLQDRYAEEMQKSRLAREAEERRRREEHEKFMAWQARANEGVRLREQEEAGRRAFRDTAVEPRRESKAEPDQPRHPSPGNQTEAMHPAMAAAVAQELNRRARWDAERVRRQADRDEYEHQLRTR